MLSSTIVASILALAVQTASASAFVEPMAPDQAYPSGPVHRAHKPRAERSEKGEQKRDVEVKVFVADGNNGDRDDVDHDFKGPRVQKGGEREIVIHRMGPGGESGPASARAHGNVPADRDGGPREMRVRILRDGDETPGDRNLEHRSPGARGGAAHGPEQRRADGGPHHFGGAGTLENLPPQVREHIRQIIRGHMQHMRDRAGPGGRNERRGEQGFNGPRGPHHQGGRDAMRGPGGPRGPRAQGGPGVGGGPGMGQPGMRGPAMGGQGMPNPGMDRPGMGGPGNRQFNGGGARPQMRGQFGPGGTAPDGPRDQRGPAGQGGPGAAPGGNGPGPEMRKQMIERLEKRLEQLKHMDEASGRDGVPPAPPAPSGGSKPQGLSGIGSNFA